MRRLIPAVAIGAALAMHTSVGAQATPLAKGCDADNAGLVLPAGFCAGVFAKGLPAPRHMAVAANGDVFVITNPGRGRGGASQPARGVYRLRDANKDGRADSLEYVAPGTGSGIGIANNALYAESGGTVIVRYPFKSGSTDLAGSVDTIVSGIPAGPDHVSREFVVRGNDLFVNIGSGSNICDPLQQGGAAAPSPDPCPELPVRAGIWKFDANKKGQVHSPAQRYATGFRNGVSITLNPADNGVYSLQHGRDQLGLWNHTPEYNAENPGEEFFRIVGGKDYGWPYCYYSTEEKKKVTSPEYGGDGKSDDRCRDKEAPIYAFPAHWAPNGALFYTGSLFPAEYKQGVFVAFHGSWNRAPLPQAGFNVTFLPMKDGKAAGAHRVFAQGFQAVGQRPTGLAQLGDGSLLVSDDARGNIFRISYTGR